MFCCKCGKEVKEEDIICPNCGEKLCKSNQETKKEVTEKGKNFQSVYGVMGFVFSIIGLIISNYCGIPLLGLGFSIVGLVDNKKKKKSLWLAISGIIISACAIFLFVIKVFSEGKLFSVLFS